MPEPTEVRSYRVNRIQGVRVTAQYAIELFVALPVTTGYEGRERRGLGDRQCDVAAEDLCSPTAPRPDLVGRCLCGSRGAE